MVMKKRALIVGTYVNAPYHPFQQVDHALAELLAPDFDVTVTDDLSAFRALAGVNLCVSYIDMFDAALPEGTGEAILSFVRGGGGLLCLHNGISLQTDERLFHLIGGKFTEHPPQTELRFTPAEDGFLQGMEGFSMSEEPYQFEMSGDEGCRCCVTSMREGNTWAAGAERRKRGEWSSLHRGTTSQRSAVRHILL